MVSQKCIAAWSSEDIVRDAVSESVQDEASYLRFAPERFDSLERIRSANQRTIRADLYGIYKVPRCIKEYCYA